MNVKGIVYAAAFYFTAIAFGWKVALGALAFIVISNVALAT